MNKRWLARCMVLGFAVPSAVADVVDDMGVQEQQFAKTVMFAQGGAWPGPKRQVFLGLPLSDAHAAAIEARLGKFGSGPLAGFLESRGDFKRALESGKLPSLDRVRLLLRAGRPDEARSEMDGEEMDGEEMDGEEMDGEEMGKLRDSQNPGSLLLAACRPLEDSQAWDELRDFLRLLGERLNSPRWRIALWSEELDVAWHLDRVSALLGEVAGDPLKLAVFHHRLGNVEERDRLAAGLLENAAPDRVVELLGLLPDSPLVTEAAVRSWGREDLAVADRVALFAQLVMQPQAKDFEELFRAWLVKGGDALPLADTIWQRWSASQTDTPQRTAVLSALLQSHPDEPRFGFLVGRQLMKSDDPRATELFEKIAALPLTATPKVNARSWQPGDLRSIPDEIRGDLPFLAIRGLALMDRQDRIREVLDRQAGWAALPLIDRARYLAAGRMDFALVKLVLDADFSKPENDGLAGGLQVVLEQRLTERTLPPELARQIAAKFDSLAAGSPEKNPGTVTSDARGLLETLADAEVDALVEAVRRLIPAITKRDPAQAVNLENQLRGVAARHPRLKTLFPDNGKPPSSQGDDISEAMAAQDLIALFAMPQIRRISAGRESNRFERDFFPGQFGGPGGTLPLNLLTRWFDTPGMDYRPMQIPGLGRPVKKEQQTGIQTLMRHFTAGNPRRLLAEVLIAKGRLDCGDEALKAEAKASFTALMAGEKEARGTEAFRFAVLSGEPREAKDDLRKVLAAVKSLPPSGRTAFLQQLMTMRTVDRMAMEMARRELGLAEPERPRPDAKPDGDVEKFKALAQQDLTFDPDSAELARRILGNAAMAAGAPPDPANIYPAMGYLEKNEALDPWLKEIREKLRVAGIPELEALRRLQRIDLRQGDDGQPRSAAYAREILALDPKDAKSAELLVGTATAEGDRKLLFACLRAMGSEGISRLSRSEVLGIFGKEDAAEVFAIARELGAGGQPPGAEAVSNLHRYFLYADPRLATEFRGWLAGRGNSLAKCRDLVSGQLLEAGWKDEAVEVIARTFVTPREYPGFPHQFPPKPGKSPMEGGGGFSPSDLEKEVEFMRDRKLLAAVISRIEALGEADPDAMATLRMAATPDVDTFEKRVLPMLDRKGEPYRGSMLNQWVEFFSKQPATASLVLRLLEERAAAFDKTEGHRLAGIIESASTLPGGSRLLAAQWPLLHASAGIPGPVKKESTLKMMRRVLRPMLFSADDATWRSYWKWRDADPAQLLEGGHPLFGDASFGSTDPARLLQILPRMLRETGGDIPAEQAEGWALAAVAAGDKDLLGKVKAALPAGSQGAADLCDLGHGIPTAFSPVLGASREADGETLLWWNFVVVPPVNREEGGSDIPRCPFPALDGKFNLQLTAGGSPNRQEIVREIPAAASSGCVRVKLAPDQRHVGMIAVDAATGKANWSPTLEVESGDGPPLPLSDRELAEKGFEKLGWNGPGGLPAWKVRFSGRDMIDLLERPWNGSEPVALDAWVSGAGKLALRCLDAAGKELQTLDLVAWDAPTPVWQFRGIRAPGKTNIPAETTRLVLSASVHGYNDGPLDFSFSNVRMKIGPPAALPEGFERITRVPGSAVRIELSPDAKHLAIGLKSGKLVILDLASREAVEVPLRPVAPEDDHRSIQMTWGLSGLYVLPQSDCVLYRVDGPTRKLDRVRSLRRGNGSSFVSLKVSDDGKWIVWSDQRHRLVLASSDGTIRREIDSRTSSPFGFTDEGLHWIDDNENRLLLKTADFPAGDPVEDTGTGWNRSQPNLQWNNRLDFNRGPGAAEKGKVRIAAGKDTVAFAAEGLLYFVDVAGNVIRATP